jgi:hypothetical protein
MKHLTMFFLLFALFSLNVFGIKIPALVVKTELKLINGKYSLYRDGKPYYVNGAGCEFGNIENLASHGANSMRTWRTENGRKSGKEILDEAYKNGLTVLMGIEIHRERHGFDYNDSLQVQQQLDSIQIEIMKYKDHPALLGWDIGNELNLGSSNLKVWDAVNNISKMIHRIDGNHPTTTSLAGVPKDIFAEIKKRCLDLDFLSFQSYGGVVNLVNEIKEVKYEGPYMITEWGATGHWEVPLTEWKIPIEETSSEKAKALLLRWNKAVIADTLKCLGSYVFVWEQKQERTPTWYGLISESGEETEETDVMQFCWTGKWPENRAPSIDSVFIDHKTRYDNIHLTSGSKSCFNVYSTDVDGDSLSIRCEILQDITSYFGNGGDFEKRPPSIFKKEIKSFTNAIFFEAPAESGSYRFFVYVTDGHNNVGTANIPFFVDSKTK